MEQARRARNVAILIYDNVEILDFTGPYEVFLSGSNRGKDLRVFTVAEQAGPVQALGGLSVNPAYTFQSCPHPDILVVPGGWGARAQMNRQEITGWVRNAASQAELVLSVCTGALILAKAQLLDELKVTTYHSALEELREAAGGKAEIVEGVRYIDNGKIILSAGVSAGIDMSLYILGKLFGDERAKQAAMLMEYEWR